MTSEQDKNGTRRRDFLRSTLLLSGGYVLTRVFLPGLARADYREGEVKSAAKLVGRVTFEGDVPKPILRPVTSDFEVAGKDPRVWEGVTVGKNKGVKDAVIVVNGALEGKPFPGGAPKAYAKGATILPRVDVFAWKEDIKLELDNQDPILHSWEMRLKAEVKGNRAHPKGSEKIEVSLSEPGLYELSCSPHPWERAFRMGVPHPYFAKTDEEGRFEIEGLPRGDYTVSIWGEGLTPKRVWLPVHQDTVNLDRVFRSEDVGKKLREQK